MLYDTAALVLRKQATRNPRRAPYDLPVSTNMTLTLLTPWPWLKLLKLEGRLGKNKKNATERGARSEKPMQKPKLPGSQRKKSVV